MNAAVEVALVFALLILLSIALFGLFLTGALAYLLGGGQRSRTLRWSTRLALSLSAMVLLEWWLKPHVGPSGSILMALGAWASTLAIRLGFSQEVVKSDGLGFSRETVGSK